MACEPTSVPMLGCCDQGPNDCESAIGPVYVNVSSVICPPRTDGFPGFENICGTQTQYESRGGIPAVEAFDGLVTLENNLNKCRDFGEGDEYAAYEMTSPGASPFRGTTSSFRGEFCGDKVFMFASLEFREIVDGRIWELRVGCVSTAGFSSSFSWKGNYLPEAINPFDPRGVYTAAAPDAPATIYLPETLEVYSNPAP